MLGEDILDGLRVCFETVQQVCCISNQERNVVERADRRSALTITFDCHFSHNLTSCYSF